MQADEDLQLVEEKNMDQSQDIEECQGTKVSKLCYFDQQGLK